MRTFLFAVLPLLFGLVAVELVLSAAGAWRRARALTHPEIPLHIVRDEALGWHAMPARRVPLGIDRWLTTDADGWRRDDRDADRPLLVVLGDSFTYAAGVADGEVYYDLLSEALDVGVTALAVNGYGTVQALALARRERPLLPQPVALLLQLADNDVINDSYRLERRSWKNNNLLPRPYLAEDGDLLIRDPRRIFEHATFGRELTRRLLAPALRSVEDRIESHDPAVEDLYRSELDHTARALTLLRRVWPDVPAWAFDVSGSRSRMGGDLARLSRAAGFVYLDLGMPFADPNARRPLLQNDGAHWTGEGHALAGRRLVILLEDMGALSTRQERSKRARAPYEAPQKKLRPNER